MEFEEKVSPTNETANSNLDETQEAPPEQVIMSAGRHQALMLQLNQEKVQNIWS